MATNGIEFTGVPLLLYPGEPGFNEILASNKPPNSKDKNFIVRHNSGGVLEAINSDSKDFIDYLYGGEYDSIMDSIEDEYEP